MKLFSGIGRWFRGKTNALLSWFEDPKKILGQTIEDMRAEYQTAKNNATEVQVAYRRKEKEVQRARLEVTRWTEEVDRAVEARDDTRAREAIARKKDKEVILRQAEDLLEKQAQLVLKYNRTIDLMAAKIREADSKKDKMESQIKYNEDTQKITEAASAIGASTGDNAFATFDRISGVVDDATVRAEVSSEMAIKEVGDLRLLEANTNKEIEEELRKTKERLLLTDKAGKS